LDTFGFKGVYLTVGEAVADISSANKAQPWFSIKGCSTWDRSLSGTIEVSFCIFAGNTRF
jgi:hypothetical protein